MQARSDQEAFGSWLAERRLVDERRIRYFVGWVERFLRLRAARPREAWQDTLRVFLEDLDEGQTQSWQLRQAADAVTLYCGQFCVQDVTAACAEDHNEVESPEPGEALKEMRRLMQLRHYSPRTESSYLGWARRFLGYVQTAGSRRLTSDDVSAFLSHLATSRKVAASTQNQAFNALLFLYRNVLHVDLGDMSSTVRARRGRKLPVVLSPEETRAILAEAEGLHRIMLELV